MQDGPWLPHKILNSAIAQKFPAGSVVFFPPFDSKRATIAPALRFDLKDDDGELIPWVFWLQGGPWGADEARRTATLCSDMYHADRRIFGIEPTEQVKIEIELNLAGTWQEEFSWTNGLGAVASTPTGLKIAGVDFSNRRHSPVPIDVATWRYDPSALRREVHAKYLDWRLRIWDGDKQMYCTLNYFPPKAKD